MSIARQKRISEAISWPPRPDQPETGTKGRPKRTAPVWRQMDGLEWRAIQALSHVRFPIGSIHKRVARNLAYQLEIVEITDKQAAYLWALVFRYRRQIPSKDLVEHARQRYQSTHDARRG